MNQALYIVDFPRKTEFAEAAVIPVEYDYSKFISCPACGRRVSGGYWKQPREIVLTKHKVPDFLYAYCDNTPFLISENALEKIKRADLKGIILAQEVESVRFQRKSKKEALMPKYYHIELEHSHITVDHQNSTIVYGRSSSVECCPLCRQIAATYDFFRSLSFHMEAYEGYDIFQIYELGNTVFLSQKFVDFYQKNTMTNLHFKPAQKHDQWAASYFLDGNENA